MANKALSPNGGIIDTLIEKTKSHTPNIQTATMSNSFSNRTTRATLQNGRPSSHLQSVLHTQDPHSISKVGVILEKAPDIFFKKMLACMYEIHINVQII
jgi:hypothetical protein